VTERPILFSAPMVRAILDGRKTQTRRAVKRPASLDSLEASPNYPGEWVPWVDGDPQESILCPYGVPGDTLWVRESWCAADVPSGFCYMADHPGDPRGLGWRPSIHMPRKASRLTLRITNVRVERLQDISEADAIAEGLYRSKPDDDDRAWFAAYTEEQSGSPPTPGEWETFNAGVWMVPGVPQGWGMTPAERRRDTWGPTPQFCYRLLWEHINGKGGWAANPWVWAVSCERLV